MGQSGDSHGRSLSGDVRFIDSGREDCNGEEDATFCDNVSDVSNTVSSICKTSLPEGSGCLVVEATMHGLATVTQPIRVWEYPELSNFSLTLSRSAGPRIKFVDEYRICIEGLAGDAIMERS